MTGLVVDRRPSATRSRADGALLLPYAILRMAGFPFDWLDELADRKAAVHAWRVLEARRSGRPKAERELAEQTFRTAFAAGEARGARSVVTRFRADPALRGVLVVSSPSVYDHLGAWLDRVEDPLARSADRNRLDTLVRYLQRVCAKNDTTSHFGPFGLARLEPSADGVIVRRDRQRRFPGVSRWAAEALLDAIGRDPRAAPALRPRVRPIAELRGRALYALELDYGARRVEEVGDALRTRPPLLLDDVDAAIVRACSGDRTVGEIAAEVASHAVHVTPEDVVRRLHSLDRHGVVVVGLELPYGVRDPLPHLRAAVEGHPDATAWRAVLDEIAFELRRFARSDNAHRRAAVETLERTFASATGTSPAHDAGPVYGDRMVVNELCTGPFDGVEIGGARLDSIRRDVRRVCELLLFRPRRRFEAERRVVAAWYERRFGDREASLPEYLTAFVRDARGSALDYAPVAEAVAGANAAVDDLVLDGWRGGPRHRVSTERVDAFLAAASSPTPALCNPDVMLVAPDPSEDPAGADVVVGEVHVSTEALSHSSFAPFLEERFPGFADDVLAAYRRLLAPDEELVDVTQVHRNRTWARAVLPLPDLELAGRSPAPRERVLAPADLVVFPSATGLRLRRRTGGPFLRLKANPLAWCGVERNPFSVFAFPAGAGGLAVHGRARDHLPRIRIGRAIVQRERWLVPVDELAGRDRAEQFLAAQSVRARHGLPRRIYARVAGEGKPIYCDLDSPLLVRQLARMAAGATGAAELTEMLPAPERLWLRDERGRYTSELRYASFHLGGRAEA